MYVIVFCERSGMVRRALRARGIDAYSNDIFPADDGDPHHYQCDARDLLYLTKPDAFIAHPECRYVSHSGMHWNSRGYMVDGRPRAELTQEALEFASIFFNSTVPIKVIENPKSIFSTYFRKPEQKVQPYQLGDDASKETWFWIEGTDERIIIDPAKRVPGRLVNGKERWSNQTDSGQNRLPPSEDRSRQRADTYPGIANGLADMFARIAAR